MPELIHIRKRLTRRYNDDHAYLDEWQDLGRVKLLAHREVDPGNGFDDTGSYLVHAVAPAGLNPRDVRRALRDSMSYGGCSHEYDCCGCPSAYAKVRQITPRTFSILVRTGRNY